MYKKGKTFSEHLEEESKIAGHPFLYSPPTTNQDCLMFLKDYLLGEDWYSTNTMSVAQDQVNTDMVHEILMKYSRKYRKERRKLLRRGRRHKR